ncbi:MAG: hypothetical protein IJ466_05105 [Clostridia bacterium]|nr:hypothetical protein [Clostridia bacterium]
MKKLISAVLALMLVLSALCGAMAEVVDVTGEWFLTAIKMGEAAMDPAGLGMEITMTLNADGSASLNALGVETAGSWAQEGEKYILTDEEGPMEFTLVNGALESAADESGFVMVFEKEKAEAAPAAAVRTGVSVEDFNGSWDATETEMLGMRVPVEMAGVFMNLNIENGHVTLTTVQGEESRVQEGEGTLLDDALVVGDPNGSSMPLQLLDDGTMVLVQAADGLEIRMYFEKIVEE